MSSLNYTYTCLDVRKVNYVELSKLVTVDMRLMSILLPITEASAQKKKRRSLKHINAEIGRLRMAMG